MNKLPHHLAIIADGNRRWAKLQGKTEFTGHRYAVETTVEKLVDHAIKLKIPYLTFWFFSTENWRRGETWVEKFFNLFRDLLPKSSDKLNQKGVKLNFIGDQTKLPKDIQKAFTHWQEKTKTNHKITVTIAFNYGGRDEILRAINKLPSSTKTLTEKEFSKYLDTKNLPDPDLLIRTGGYSRFSNFMLWQLAYTQLYFTDVLFPNFDANQLDKTLKWYSTQTQNLGK